MDIREFLKDGDWDQPFFKFLSHNDTGEAKGNQAGIVVPMELRKFFPALDEERISPRHPTVGRELRVEMYLEINYLADATARYQFQTWGGRRKAESRITDNISLLRNIAKEDDVLIFQRRLDDLDLYRFVLVRKASQDYRSVSKLALGRRWGALFSELPTTQAELKDYTEELNAAVDLEFTLITSVERVVSRRSRIVRCIIFPELVRGEYRKRCCVTDIAITTPTNASEVEAAHVVPVSVGGRDEVRNGIALTRTLHWAFDRGLFGFLNNRTVYLPRKVRAMPESAFLMQFEGRKISEAKTEKCRVHPEALNWHFENCVKQWE